MAYATLEQLASLFGAEEIRALSDRTGTGALDEEVVRDALERASSEVDSYLADRYATPLTGEAPVPAVVVSIRQRYVQALHWLRDVADGRASVPGLPPAEETAGGAVLVEPGSRPWGGARP